MSDIKSFASYPRKLLPWHSIDSGKIPIGIIDPCYGSSRVIFSNVLPKYAHYTMPTIPVSRVLNTSTFWQYSPFVINKHAKLLHTWNSIPFNHDFVVSHELELPRFFGEIKPWMSKRGLDHLASDRCKGIFSTSQFAFDYVKKRFAQAGYTEIIPKLRIFRGSIKNAPHKEKTNSSQNENSINAIIVGTALFRKGGTYAIQAFDRLNKQGINANLTIVGDFETSCYVLRDNIPSRDFWIKMINEKSWINFIPPTNFNKIYSLLENADVCICTSIDESLGWLPIEASMASTPVIGTNIGAFSEFILHNSTGHLIDIPLDSDRRWTGLHLAPKEQLSELHKLDEIITNGIVNSIHSIMKNKSILNELGKGANTLAHSMYSAEQAAQLLSGIYDDAFLSR